MIVLGVDPSLTMTAVAAYDTEAQTFLDVTAFPATGETMAERLYFLAYSLDDFSHQVGVVGNRAVFGIEESHVNPKQGIQSALKQRETIGALSALAGERGWKEVRVAPTQVKKAMTGHGGASKAQMVAMAMKHLDISDYPMTKRKDIADAMGVCLAATHRIITG